jgi:biopolymer transport protein ExbD
MSLKFACTQCGRELTTYVRAAGRKVRCPDCDTQLTIPQPSAAESAAAAAKGDENSGDLQVYDDLEIVEDLPELEPIPVPPPVIRPRKSAAARTSSRPTKRRARGAFSGEESPLISPHRAHSEDLIDMTAMVDIVFFLLIFFLVTSLQALEAVMDLPTPQQTAETGSKVRSIADYENDPNYIIVQIEDDDSIWVEDIQVFNDQDLRSRLRAARTEGERPRSLLVIGDADASHSAAVRVFDAGAGARVSGISLLVQEQSDRSR